MTSRFSTREITSFQITDSVTGHQDQFSEPQWTTAQLLAVAHPQDDAKNANSIFLAQLFNIPVMSAEILFEANAELLNQTMEKLATTKTESV